MPNNKQVNIPTMVYLPRELHEFVKMEAITEAVELEESVSLSRWLVRLVHKEYERKQIIKERLGLK